MRGNLTVLGCCLAGLVLSACEGPPVVSTIDHIDLWTPQTTANLDRQPGAEGVQALVFLYADRGGKPATVLADGNLEVMLYTRPASSINPLTDKPFRTWTYSREELRQIATKRSGLWCYPLMLTWGEDKPASRVVSVLARYLGTGGQVVYSRPVILPFNGE